MWHADFCSSCCRRLCRHRLLRRPHRRSLSAVAVARLACVPPTFLACRSLLSLLSSAMPFSAVASASPSLSSAVAFAYLNFVCAAVLCCVARCCRWCRRHAVALIGLCRYSHCSCACHRSAWRATRCFPWCRQLAVALISCCRSSTHSLAVRCSAQRAAYCSRCRCRLCRPCLSRRPRRCSHRLSPLLNSTHSLAFSSSSWFAARCCRRLCHRQLSHRPRHRSHRLSLLLASLARVPQLCVAYHSLLSLLSFASIRSHLLQPFASIARLCAAACLACCSSLLLQSSVMPSPAVGLSLPLLSSAAAVVRLARLCAAAQRGKLLAALAAIIHYDVVGCRVVFAVALIGCRRCSLRLRAAALLLLLSSAMPS